ncbi:DNA-binding protein [Longispora sp. K20-0274]|uniref:DNA-binding protein n=1 Tax=Longispora sp. K20-0274 TaxID=3088255 RepID=UPI00399AC90F
MIFNRKKPRIPGRRQRPVWTVDDVRTLGMTTDVETAASIIGIGRTLAYELAAEDEFPVKVRKVRRRRIVSVPDLLRYLGVEP